MEERASTMQPSAHPASHQTSWHQPFPAHLRVVVLVLLAVDAEGGEAARAGQDGVGGAPAALLHSPSLVSLVCGTAQHRASSNGVGQLGSMPRPKLTRDLPASKLSGQPCSLPQDTRRRAQSIQWGL